MLQNYSLTILAFVFVSGHRWKSLLGERNSKDLMWQRVHAGRQVQEDQGQGAGLGSEPYASHSQIAHAGDIKKQGSRECRQLRTLDPWLWSPLQSHICGVCLPPKASLSGVTCFCQQVNNTQFPARRRDASFSDGIICLLFVISLQVPTHLLFSIWTSLLAASGVRTRHEAASSTNSLFSQDYNPSCLLLVTFYLQKSRLQGSSPLWLLRFCKSQDLALLKNSEKNVTMKSSVFWDVMSRDSCRNRRFESKYVLNHQDDKNF
jgi:hypothetical protein